MNASAPTVATASELRALFDELVDLAPAERAHRLDKLDASTRDALAAMLRGADAGLALLDVPAAEVLHCWRQHDPLAERLVGRRIGSFDIVELLGEGGSSVVVRAQRAAGSAMQVVALKVLRTGVFTAEARWRFAREQAILTQLDHPNIAHLIEGGISDDGLPYFAMELVEGEPITQYADHHALSLRERMALIATLCRAVEAAHSALVVHRDLKPSNVLVTREGMVKVLDFGIAKSLSDDTPAYTTQAIMLTPEYAAPEQFRPGPVTSAADVYALGVLLGELLTGQLLGGRRTVRASELLREPNARTPTGLPESVPLARLLRGDIDAMLATALAEEPGRRYRSAGAMADDLERYLANRPVHAHPPSRWYRARKFVQRHRGGVLLTSLLAIGLIASLVMALWQADSARRAAERATLQAARADALRDFMLDAFSQAQPSTPGATDATVVDVVERAVSTVRADRHADPRVRVELLTRLAQVLGARDKQQRSAELLTQAQHLAADVLPPDDALREGIALAQVRNAIEQHDYDAARTQLNAALSRIPAAPSGIRVQALIDSATLSTYQGDVASARTHAEAALNMARALNDADAIHDALRALGSALIHGGDAQRSIEAFEQALSLQRTRYGDAHVDVAADEDALASAYHYAGDLARAEQHARAAVATDDRAMPGDHIFVAYHLNTLSLILLDRRAYPDALVQLSRVIAIQSRGDASMTNLAANYENAGIARGALGEWTAAVAALQQAHDILGRAGHQHTRAGLRVRMRWAWALAHSGEVATATTELDEALRHARALQPVDRQLVGNILERKIAIAIESRKLDAAQSWMGEYADLANALRDRPLWPGRGAVLHAELALALGQADQAWLALADVDTTLAGDVRVDPEVRAAVPILRLLAAQRGAVPSAALPGLLENARTAYSALPYPPPTLRRLAEAAGIAVEH
jgi:serine/threonine-protein kinase